METAVEWLLDNLNSEPYSEADFKHNKECWDKAKEMEKEQRGYSEEEVIELLTQRCNYFGTSLSPFNAILLKQDLEWFEKFK
jgi:hypothetical protein